MSTAILRVGDRTFTDNELLAAVETSGGYLMTADIKHEIIPLQKDTGGAETFIWYPYLIRWVPGGKRGKYWLWRLTMRGTTEEARDKLLIGRSQYLANRYNFDQRTMYRLIKAMMGSYARTYIKNDMFCSAVYRLHEDPNFDIVGELTFPKQRAVHKNLILKSAYSIVEFSHLTSGLKVNGGNYAAH